MEIRNKIKPFLPHLVAVIIFTIISFVYFYPVLEGKVLKANDSTVSKIYSKEIHDFRAKYNKEPLWTNSIFCGMPAYLISTLYPGNLFKHLDTVLRSYRMPVAVLFLSMAGFYVLLLLFRVNPWLAIVGALGYGLSSFLFQIIAAGHNTQAIALAYMAPMIGGIYYAYRYDAIKGALFTAFFLSLELLSNHPQMTYYAMICLLVFVITELIFSIKQKAFLKFIRTSAILIIPFIIAIGINFAFLYTTWEYGKYSLRGKSDLTTVDKNVTSGLDKDYITYWSYGVDETLNLLIPNYKGGSSKPFDRDSETLKVLRQNNAASAGNQFQKYWGTQPGTDGPHYVGAIVVFLFILGLIIIKGPEKWWLLIATVLSVMLAWGKNFMPLTNFFIEYFPGYNKFRAVTMILVIAQFCIPLLGILALRDIFNGNATKKELLKGVRIAAGITCGLIVLILIIPGIAGSFISQYEAELKFPDWLTNALIADRKGLLKTDSFRSLIFILLAAGTIFGFLYEKLRKEYAIVAVAALIFLDLWTVDKRYLNANNFEKPSVIQKSFTPAKADDYILNDPSYHRVWNRTVSTFNDNSPTSYFHKSIGGYHGAKLKRYQELIDSSIIRDFQLFESVAKNARTIEELLPVLKNTSTLNMLNTKYIIYNPDAPPIVNPNSLGNAWFVEKPVLVENANKEIMTLKTINPSTEAVIDKIFEDQITQPSYPVADGETIELVSFKSNELVYKYSARSEKLAVFSEIYYPAGWKCSIDGKESKYFRADYVLRAMIVPGGNHEIKFVFEPASYIIGNKISLASSIILILLLAGFLVLKLKKR
ncbi:MAG: YfhO family protein [Bacteroidales bacterium]|nr:YfhO family protein [Bacteroidales bacterium]